MRELKFRVWDKVNKEMFTDFPSEYTRRKIGKDTNLMVMDLENVAISLDGQTLYIMDECGNYEYLNMNDYIIEQYTGLTDKDGKEIYEGDRIKHALWGEFNIVRDDMDAAFRAVSDDGETNLNLGHAQLTSCRIIGNSRVKRKRRRK